MPIIIRFESGSSILSDQGKAVLDIAFLAPRKMLALTTRVTIEAHTDSIGSKASNLALSRRRAVAVRDYLTRNGVAGNLIDLDPKGESHAMVPTDDEVAESSNRYVRVFEQLTPERLAALEAVPKDAPVC